MTAEPMTGSRAATIAGMTKRKSLGRGLDALLSLRSADAAPSDTPGTANVDFVIFPPRWMVAEDTFRPPWFHRNVMSEYMGLIHGSYDAKAGGFVPGGGSLPNCMSSHGPDAASHAAATQAQLRPHKTEETMAFMFESRHVIAPTRWAMETPLLQDDYDACWNRFAPARLPGGEDDPA